MKKMFIIFLLLINNLLFSQDISIGSNTNSNTNSDNIGNLFPYPPDFEFPKGEIPLVPIMPEIPTTGRDKDKEGNIRLLEKTYTVMLEAKVNVFVPLEVITDINIEGTVVGDQILDIPFEIELNRKPEKENYYRLKYSENIIDIDNDGNPDTYIFSPKYINEKLSKDNFVRVYGSNISKEGTYKKDIYITVEVGN
ncbi:hypothetical protein [Fusobacterium perfoetens]|uniref:hypothetical protein n=1 Tax=Fusobacterium perfoetens TaxID=852 RepID=UPI000484D2CE|nr:hypothetical protein [Fusobacterium perfoetens]MCI6152127.1 hypothetical protein [Fusobacterium perfoetens]MDY3237982.1 hypothetical protein [Fusobacterium perfoetens]